jgi:hypothetical protein
MTAVSRTLLAALVFCMLSALPASAAAAASGGGEPLAPALRELARPSVRALPAPAQARRLGIAASGPGSLIREDGEVLVEASFDAGAPVRLPALREAGAEIVASSGRYQVATVRVPIADLTELAAVPGVTSVTPVRAPVTRLSEPCRGSVVTEGIAQLQVEAARAKLEAALGEAPKEGEGLTVGVLSDSYNQATEAVSGGPIATKAFDDVTTQDLPGGENSCPGEQSPVLALEPYKFGEEGEPPFDEGRAMLQIVHDIAPKAKLAFTSAFNGEVAFAKGIEKLAEPVLAGGAEANVIVDDVGYFAEPFFQDGPVAVAIDKVVAAGVTYLTAAGNDNLFDAEGDEIASWEAPEFQDSGGCPAAVRALPGLNTSHCLDFDPEAPVDRTFGIKVEPGETLTVDLQWAEPWFGVGTDLDAYLLDAEGHLLTFSAERQATTKKPVEILQWENQSAAERTVQLVINRRSGLSPRLKFILLENGGGVSATEYPRSGGGDVVGPAIYGHAGAAAAITLGAIRFSKTEEPERYSSRGPVTHYFGPVEEAETPAPPLLPAEVISKPDATATDCGRTTFFASEVQVKPPIWRFCGTSAAAPHAAGLATLAIEAKGGPATPAEVKAALVGTTVPIGAFGPCAVGAGLLEAKAAVEAMRAEITPATPAACEPPDSSGQVQRAAGEWGLEEPPKPPLEPEEEKKPEEKKPEEKPPTPTPTPQPPVETRAAPATVLLGHPKKLVRTSDALAKVVFRFGSEPAGASFRCQFDGSPWRGCAATVSRWFGLGAHVVRVQAKSNGVFDPTPIVYRFMVARSR